MSIPIIANTPVTGRKKSDSNAAERAALDAAHARALASGAPGLQGVARGNLEVIMDAAERKTNKSALHVIITLALKKAAVPEQDIRQHQKELSGGFSGRGLDERVTTPFLNSHHLSDKPSSGWLTRSFEQMMPYDNGYPGSIRPRPVKAAFLAAVGEIQSGRIAAEEALVFLLAGLIKRRDANRGILLNRPTGRPVAEVIRRLAAHFGQPNSSRLPTLAVHAAYQCLVAEMRRYDGCKLRALEPHTAADTRTGALGDVQVDDADGKPMEAVEIKHNIPLTAELVRGCRAKFEATQVRTFYLLSTKERLVNEAEIDGEIRRIQNGHGCHVIVNGVTPTLKYYLRLLANVDAFVSAYATHAEKDPAINYALKAAWNQWGEEN